MNATESSNYVARVDERLRQILDTLSSPVPRFNEAMAYSLFPGGKRLRPVLCYLSGHMLGIEPKALDDIAASLELVHAYSLVHDDLPAMDDDDFRRGKLSLHRAYNEATAILVGDALNTLAFEWLLHTLPSEHGAEASIAISKNLMQATGQRGMIAGQYLDLMELSNPDLQLEDLARIHQLKTGCLIQSAIEIPSILKPLSDDNQHHLKRFATLLGLTFQMQDDYLDAYAEPQVLGKNRRSDHAQDKRTFAQLFDEPTLYQLIEQNAAEAVIELKPFGMKADRLVEYTDFLMQRHRTLPA